MTEKKGRHNFNDGRQNYYIVKKKKKKNTASRIMAFCSKCVYQ